ncbi:hypothetical protein ACOSP7_014324 [Xanthoceras sorbifolium]
MSFVLQPDELVLCLVSPFFFLTSLCIYSHLFADDTGSNPLLFEEEKTTLDALTALVAQDPRRLTAYKWVTEKLLLEFKLTPDISGVLQHLAEHGIMAADYFSIRQHNEGVEFRLLLTVRFRRVCPIRLSSSVPLSSIVQLSPSEMESVLANYSDLDFGMLQGDLASCDICHGCFIISFSLLTS